MNDHLQEIDDRRPPRRLPVQVAGGALLLAALALVPWAGAIAQDAPAGHAGHAGHATHRTAGTAATGDATAMPDTPLREPGQGAFAALTEAVVALNEDPATDWSRVDIDGLRDHLVQMDLLISDTTVETRPLPDGTEFIVHGEGRALEAIHTMVPAHAAVLPAATTWSTDVAMRDDGAMLRVTADDPRERERIAALGFYGVMATGDHHREHHWAMARGDDAHAMPGH